MPEDQSGEKAVWTKHMAVEPAEMLYSLQMEGTSRVVLALLFLFFGICSVLAIFELPAGYHPLYMWMELLTALCLFGLAAFSYFSYSKAKKQIKLLEREVSKEQP